MSLEQIARDMKLGVFPNKSELTLLDEQIDRLREALKFARKRIVYYGTISDRRHFDHDMAEVYPKIDAAIAADLIAEAIRGGKRPS